MHTPGPWHVGGHEKMKTIVYASDGWAVANATVFHQKHAGEAPCNARLIAAAPDLLAALKGLLEFPDTHGYVTFPLDGEAAEAARAAIAKVGLTAPHEPAAED